VSFYEILVFISLILWIALSLVAIVSMLVLLPRVLAVLRQFQESHEEFLKKAFPILDQSRLLLDLVGTLETSLAVVVERIDRTVIRTSCSVEGMVELAEERVSEINALLEVAVEEAEETFFSTAAIMRALRLGGRSRKRRKLSRGERRRTG
jgi:hypothetical protein